MAVTLDLSGGFAVDMQDPATLYGTNVLGGFNSPDDPIHYWYLQKGYGQLEPLSFHSTDNHWQLRLWGHDFQYTDGEESGGNIDLAFGTVTRIEAFGPTDLAADAVNPPTHRMILTLGEGVSMQAAIDALIPPSETHTAPPYFSSLYAGQALSVVGGILGDRLLGGTASDTLAGDAGDDVLRGGRAADVLAGGAGQDTLTGGAGQDQFLFENKGGANADRITDFTDADTIVLELGIFPELEAGKLRPGMFKAAADITVSGGGATVDANDHILYNTDSGKLYYDSNGSAAGGRVLVATLSDHPTLVPGDFVVI